MADLIKADERARILHGWNIQERNNYLVNNFNIVAKLMEQRWREVVKLAQHIAKVAPEPGGVRRISGNDVHDLLGYRAPTDAELDRCPEWSGST